MSVRKSASRIEAYNRCQAYYGYKYILKLPDPPGPHLKYGLEVHDQLEQYYKTSGEYIPTHPAAIALLRHLPKPAPHIVSEGEIEKEWYGHKWIAILDLREFYESHVVIRDHKTTGSLKWAYEKDLYTDTQATVYAGITFDEFEDCKKVDLNWNFVTRGKRQQTHPLFETINRNDQEWLDKAVLPVIQSANAIDVISHNEEDWIKNPDGCAKFGGCPYAGNPCVIKASTILGSRLKMGMSLAEKIAAKKAAAAANNNEETPNSTPKQEINPPTRKPTLAERAKAKSAEVSTPTPTTASNTGDISVRVALHVLADAVADFLGK